MEAARSTSVDVLADGKLVSSTSGDSGKLSDRVSNASIGSPAREICAGRMCPMRVDLRRRRLSAGVCMKNTRDPPAMSRVASVGIAGSKVSNDNLVETRVPRAANEKRNTTHGSQTSSGIRHYDTDGLRTDSRACSIHAVLLRFDCGSSSHPMLSSGAKPRQTLAPRSRLQPRMSPLFFVQNRTDLRARREETPLRTAQRPRSLSTLDAGFAVTNWREDAG